QSFCDIGAFEFGAAPAGQPADLIMVASASATSSQTGTNVTLHYVAYNVGGSIATGSSFTATLPANVSYIGNVTQSCSFSAPTVFCNLGTLGTASNGGFTIDLVVRATSAGTFNIPATVATANAEIRTNNNSASASFTAVSQPD